MNASSNIRNLQIANKVASTAALFLKYFPDANPDFRPMAESNENDLVDTIEFSFYFPGWNPKIECNVVLFELKIENNYENGVPKLLGIIMRGMSNYERWRVATIGDWEMTGKHIPEKKEKDNFVLVCKELYNLFSTTSAGNKN